METRELELRQCRAEVEELSRRVDALRLRIDTLEGKAPVPVQPEPVPVQIPVQAEKPKRSNLESAVGRNLFAVLASVLVLIGVGVFISTIYEQIPEIVKIAAIYIFGFAVLGVGLVLYRKNDNKFWLGVASCGLAELLVSIITSHSYFGVLPLTGTFLLVLVWIAVSFCLTKFHPTVFKTIGFIGFLISMALGLSLLERDQHAIYLTLLGAYAVLSVFFMVTNRSYVNMNTATACGAVAGLLMFHRLEDHLPGNLPWLAALIVFVILAGFQVIYLWRARLHKTAYPLHCLLSMAVLASFLASQEMELIVSVSGGVILVLWVLQCFCDASKTGRCFFTAMAGAYLFLPVMLRGLSSYEAASWWYLLFAAVSYGLYWFTRRRDIAWLGLICFVSYRLFDYYPDWMSYVLLAAAGLMVWLCGGKWLRRDGWLQVAWYCTAFWLAYSVMTDIRWEIVQDLTDPDQYWNIHAITNGVFYTLMAVVNTGFLHTLLRDRESILKITVQSLVVMVLQGMTLVYCMMAVDSDIWYVTALGIAGSMLILSYSLWYTFKTKGTSRNLMVWQFIKFTLYCWVVLAILESSSILMHISLLLVAILAVVLGFKLGHKAVRVYGLVLSLVDVVSLVLFNIDYGNSLQLAGGIILCGALCFVISFIYSRLSKVF